MKTKLLTALLCAACAVSAAEVKIGKPLTAKRTVTLSDLAAKPADYVGKTFRVTGKVTEVCQAMGCWVMLTDGKGAMMRIQLEEGKAAFPKDAPGRNAVAEGKLVKFDLTKEQAISMAKHEAEDAGRPFNPDSLKPPFVFYQIAGTGAVLTE